MLLISCPGERESDFCGAGLCVGVGSLDEPLTCPGLAHFTEHMMALGSEKFPGEAEYKFLVGNAGGNTNAFTADEGTAYQCTVMGTVIPNRELQLSSKIGYVNFFSNAIFDLPN